MLMKEKNVEEKKMLSHIWVKPEPNLDQISTSSVQSYRSWYACNINDEVLSQYDDEDILHSMIFYNKNMILAECNYEIYDKELLIIIRCLKHWHLELKCIDISIKIFIDHLNLKYFMIIKELTWQQAKWVEKLSEYNFKIIYQSKKQNLKVDVLIRMSDVKSVEANNDWKLY